MQVMKRNVREQQEIVDNALNLGQYQGPARPRVHYVFLITVGYGKGCVRQEAVAREVHIVARQLGLQDARRLAVVPRPDGSATTPPRPRPRSPPPCPRPAPLHHRVGHGHGLALYCGGGPKIITFFWGGKFKMGNVRGVVGGEAAGSDDG